jgi:hypothetical protein
MLVTVGLYTLTTAAGVGPVLSVYGLGLAILVATFVLSQRLPSGDRL